jgi:alkaline phosphatase D
MSFIFLLSLIIPSFCYYIPEYHNNKQINNFAFGSCFGGFLSENKDIFQAVLKRKPELWLWLGDAYYLDWWIPSKVYTEGVNKTYVQIQVNETKHDPFYSKIHNSTPTIGIWDDHDYGFNDEGKYFQYKEITKQFYLDFIDEPQDSIRRKEGRGLFTTYSFGDLKTHKNFRIILLDSRYYKDPHGIIGEPDIIGEEQWEWFEEIFKNAKETFIFIGSGTQILPYNRMVTEAWYGHSRDRLFKLLAKYRKNGVVFLSGDIHLSEVLRSPCSLPGIRFCLLFRARISVL